MAGESRKGAALSIMKGLLAAVGATLPGMAAIALIAVFAHPSDGVILALNQALKLAALFAGAWASVGPGGTRGLMLGGTVGLMYIALGYGICSLWDGLTVSGGLLAAEFLAGLLLGGVSGALIANLPAGSGRRRKARA